MTIKAKTLYYLQYMTGRLAVFFTVPLIVLVIKIFGYRIRDLGNVRKEIRQLMVRHPGPWLICPNHLTMIDSAILAYAMVPSYRYLFRYRLLPWNVPEQMNFSSNIFIVILCYLMKCIPVIRGGDRGAIQSVFGKCSYLLNKGENLVIFPEGTRSRNGRVNTEDFSYGMGRLFLSVPGTRVMCLYLRGEQQDGYSGMPRYGERFYMAAKEFRPTTTLKGLRAQRDCSKQVILHLSKMEEAYFASCRK